MLLCHMNLINFEIIGKIELKHILHFTVPNTTHLIMILDFITCHNYMIND